MPQSRQRSLICTHRPPACGCGALVFSPRPTALTLSPDSPFLACSSRIKEVFLLQNRSVACALTFTQHRTTPWKSNRARKRLWRSARSAFSMPIGLRRLAGGIFCADSSECIHSCARSAATCFIDLSVREKSPPPAILMLFWECGTVQSLSAAATLAYSLVASPQPPSLPTSPARWSLCTTVEPS